MASETVVLAVILASIFGLVLAIFLFLILRFTCGHRTLRPCTAITSSNSSAHQRPDRPSKTEEWRERWQVSTRSRRQPVRESELVDHDKVEEKAPAVSMGEFGATVHEDGTRSYLGGWFALSAPPAIHAPFLSHPLRGKHARVKTREPEEGNEWDTRSEKSDTSDPEAYRPQYATL